MLTTAPMLMTMAAIARALSKPLTVADRTGAGAGAFGFGAVGDCPAVVGRVAVAAVEVAGRGPPNVAANGAPAVGGRGALGAGLGGAGAAGAAAPAATGGADAGPPGGNDGNRIVAVGFGGKLIRTVSFLG